MTLETRWRPLATTRIDAAASLAQRSASLDSAGASPMATGRLRTSWRAPSGRVAVDLRAARLLLDANPLLVRAGAVRDEIATELDVAIVGPMRARGSARVGAVRSGGQSNGRTVVGGALVASGAGGELGARVQQLRYAAPSTGGYFAPRQADLAELSMYSEREAENGATLALDLGAGLQRIAQFEETTRGWSPALRGWAQLAMPLTRRTALGVELEAYDSRAGGDAMSATAGAWRYGSASMFIRARTR